MAHDLSTAIRELYASLRPREERILRWCAAGAAGALSVLDRLARRVGLAARPLIGGWFVFLVRRNRMPDPFGHDAEEDADWF